MALTKSRVKEYLYIYSLFIPLISRWLFLDSWESALTFSFFSYPLFLPEVMFFFLPFLWKRSYGRYYRIVYWSILGFIYLFLNCLVNEIPSLYLNFISGTDFFLSFLLLGLFPITFRQVQKIRGILLFVFIAVSMQIILYSSGILSYSGESTSTESIQMIGSLIRFRTTAGSSISSAILIFILSSILYATFEDKKKYQAGILLMGLIAVGMSLSRGAVLVYILYLIFILSKTMKTVLAKHKKYILSYSLGLIVIIITAYTVDQKLSISESFLQRLEFTSNNVTSGRDIRYDYAWEIINKNFIFGAGSGNTTPYARTGDNSIYSPSYSQSKLSPHNSYLLFFADYGICGMIIFFTLFYITLKIAFRYKRWNNLNLTLVLILVFTMNVEIFLLNIDFLPIVVITALMAGTKPDNVNILYENRISYIS